MDKESRKVPASSKPSSLEYYKKYRPKTLEDILGQSSAVEALRSRIAKDALPHAIMLTGPSGVGKTTIGRILRRILKCSSSDYHEKDCTTEEKPLEFVRELKRSVALRPMVGDKVIWFLEEFQSLSRAGFSQQALLKLLEDTPGHVYFILATTDPDKVNTAIKTRCYEVRLKGLEALDLDALITKVAEAEKLKVGEEVRDAIIHVADGSARKALVILEQVGSMKDSAAMLKAISSTTSHKESAEFLGKSLMFGAKWLAVASALRKIVNENEDVEQIRHGVLGFARAFLIGSKDGRPPNPKFCPRAYMIIDIFSRPFYDSKSAGLAAACWEVLNPS